MAIIRLEGVPGPHIPDRGHIQPIRRPTIRPANGNVKGVNKPRPERGFSKRFGR